MENLDNFGKRFLQIKIKGAKTPFIDIPRCLYETLLVHGLEKIIVTFGVFEFIEQELDRIDRSHRVENAAQYPHF